MFDIGISELVVIGIVALIVLGPERLPKAARFAGLWVRKARAQWYSVKSEFEREMAADELKRSVGNPVQDIRKEVESAGRVVGDAGREAADELREAEARARADADTAVQDIPPAAAGAAPGTSAALGAPVAGTDPEPFRLTPDDAPSPADADAAAPPRRDPPAP